MVKKIKDKYLMVVLFKMGAHLGHKSKFLVPDIEPYLYGIRKGVAIFDLNRTISSLKRALNFLSEVLANKGTFLIIETEKDFLKLSHMFGKHGHFSITEPFKPGILTNFLSSVNRLNKSAESNFKKIPDVIIFTNPVKTIETVKEANLLNIPVIAFVDTNFSAKNITYPIYCNDNSLEIFNVFLFLINKVIKQASQEEKLRFK